MVETFARPRFGEPREPMNRVNPGSRLVGVLDFVTASHARAVAFLLLCGLLLFLPGFFNIPPIDRDEARFAQATKQMVETSDFVDIRFQDDVRYKKPVGIYWLQAASVEAASALGGSTRRWRRPSIFPTETPFTRIVIGSTPPATFTGIAEGCPPVELATSIREPLSGN